MLTLIANSTSTEKTVYDAFALREECLRRGHDVSWWFPKANTIRMLAGEKSSEAYLLLSGRDLNGDPEATNNYPVTKGGFYNHKIQFDGVLSGAPFTIAGWAYHSSRCVLGSEDAVDRNAIYIVRFCDVRHFASTQPCRIGVSGALVYADRVGFNVISQTVDDSAMTYDESDSSQYPYDGGTIAAPSTPFTWESLLSMLWLSSGFTDSYGSMMSFVNTELPSGGVYPDQRPIDIRPENKTTWKVFCELLHCTGNEIYPKNDGSFRIAPLDDSFDAADIAATDLAEYVPYIIEYGHSDPGWRTLPPLVTMTFVNRPAASAPSGGIGTRNANNYITYGPYDLADSTSPPGLMTLDELAASGNPVANGVYTVDEIIPGQIEDHLTPGRSSIKTASASPANEDDNVDFAIAVLSRYYKARASLPIDVVIPYHANIQTQPAYNEVFYYFDIDEVTDSPSPRTHVITQEPPAPGVSTMPMIPGGRGGGEGDRLVGADTTDETPKELYQKTNDHDSYDDEIHQLVYTEVVTDPGSPKDNTVRFFTALGSGVAGPTGPAGSDGADGADGADGDTVDEGYAIDVDHAGTVATVHFDPTEIEDFAATFQFFGHLSTDVNRDGADSPHWFSVDNYVANKSQFIWHLGTAAWKFQTTEGYNNAANQLLFNQSDVWNWKTTDDYNNGVGVKQLLGHDGNDWKWKSVADWLNTVEGYSAGDVQLLGHGNGEVTKWDTLSNWLKKLTGYTNGSDQSLLHDSGADPLWKDDVVC